jgi:hypothetical protein
MNTATAEARKFLTATTHYKVHFGTRLHSHDPPHFDLPPTPELIVQVLIDERDQMDESAITENRRVDEAAREAHKAAWQRYDNLIELVRLVGPLRLPGAGKHENHLVTVAGVEIGHLNIQARSAWPLE